MRIDTLDDENAILAGMLLAQVTAKAMFDDYSAATNKPDDWT